MIERGFVAQKTKEYYLKQFVRGRLNNVGISSIKLKKIPLGEKIIINRLPSIIGSLSTLAIFFKYRLTIM